MGDFDPPRRGRRTVLLLLAGAALVATGIGAGWAITGWTTGPATPEAAAARPVPEPPPWTPTGTTTPAPGAAAGTVDGGQGWAVPNPGPAVGPAAVTDHGVPFGYARTPDGAALAAVNAVIAGRYLAATFTDPWEALGFLADPRFAGRGGNPNVEAFLRGPAPVLIVGDRNAAAAAESSSPAPPTSIATAGAVGVAAGAPAGGGRVLGVRVQDTRDQPGEARATVLWERFNLETQPDTAIAYTVAVEPVDVLLVWAGDWKVSRVGGPPLGMPTRVLGTVPVGFPLPAENWRR